MLGSELQIPGSQQSRGRTTHPDNHFAPITVLFFSGPSSTHDTGQSTPDDQIGFVRGDLPTCWLMGVLWARVRQARLSHDDL